LSTESSTMSGWAASSGMGTPLRVLVWFGHSKGEDGSARNDAHHDEITAKPTIRS
jgi:hypothetical protein